jgi:hypothetical protein
MKRTTMRHAAGARKRRPVKQGVEQPASAAEIVQQEVRTPTTARLTLYFGALTVNIEVGSQ